MTGKYDVDSVDTRGLDLTEVPADSDAYQGDEPDENEERDDA